MKPVLFILSGLPASGKSTLSKHLAKKHAAIYLRIDTIEQGLRDLYSLNVHSEGYGLSYRIAADNIEIGNNVIADSCNPIMLSRKEWEKVATIHDGIFINIEVTCSDENEHKKRIESRIANGVKSPSWREIKNREFHSWVGKRLIIDTANKSVETSLAELDVKIRVYLESQEQTKIKFAPSQKKSV